MVLSKVVAAEFLQVMLSEVGWPQNPITGVNVPFWNGAGFEFDIFKILLSIMKIHDPYI
jgi:hypothetical protein